MHKPRFASEQADALCDALVSIETRDQAYRLLDDLCTILEVQAMAQRLAVAQLLRGGATYAEIVKETGASTATISRVNRCLNYGAEGYAQILDRLEKREGRQDG